MGFYQQFRKMAKYTNDELCKFERDSFYKNYYEKHQNDFTQIQEKDITFPLKEEAEEELKKIIEKIFKHEFWERSEYTNQMIAEYTKIIKKRLISNREKYFEEKYFETDNPGIDLFTFQFGEQTNQLLPVNVFNYICNLRKSIQREYESFFFIKEMFSSGKNRISNLLDNTNIDDNFIFNTFRKHIYHDFYNYKIKKDLTFFNKEKQSNIIEPKLDNINEHSSEAIVSSTSETLISESVTEAEPEQAEEILEDVS